MLNGTDHHGHHYEGTIAESMTQQLLSILCPSSEKHFTALNETTAKAARSSLDEFLRSSFLSTSKLSCDRMEKLKSKKEQIEKCSCGNSSAVRSQEAKEYCAELKKRQIDAPFIVDE